MSKETNNTSTETYDMSKETYGKTYVERREPLRRAAVATQVRRPNGVLFYVKRDL